MDNIIPRVAAIHDLSGFGRCSLTVIIPVLSSMGLQVCPLPTSILSTHSGGFSGFYFHDLADHMEEYAKHWKSTGIGFDCIYSGFLGSARQIDIVAEFFKNFRTGGNQIIVVDPVMGDHGKLYKTYNPEMQKKMRILAEKADVITPNLTEACYLLEEPYTEKPMCIQEMKRFLKSLTGIGPEAAVITSVRTENGCFANIGYSRSSNTYWKVNYDYIPAHYPGTGDIFTSVLTGSLLAGDDLPVAMDRATQFVTLAVQTTYGCKTPEREGVLLEKVLNRLADKPLCNYYEIIT